LRRHGLDITYAVDRQGCSRDHRRTFFLLQRSGRQRHAAELLADRRQHGHLETLAFVAGRRQVDLVAVAALEPVLVLGNLLQAMLRAQREVLGGFSAQQVQPVLLSLLEPPQLIGKRQAPMVQLVFERQFRLGQGLDQILVGR